MTGTGGAPAGGGGTTFRREDAVVLAATLGLGVAGALVLLGVGIPSLVSVILLAASAVLAFLLPEAGLYALLLNALIGLAGMAHLPRFGPLSMPVAFEAALAAAVLFRAARGRQKLFTAAPQHLLCLALGLWLIVSLLHSGRISVQDLTDVGHLFLVRVLVFLLLTNLVLTRPALRRLVAVLILGNAGLLLTSLLVRLGLFGMERIAVSENVLVRTSAIVQNPNNLAFDLTTMLILATAAALHVKGWRLRGLLLLLAGLDVFAILTTLSRSGLVSLLAVLLFMIWKLRRDPAGLALGAALVFLVLVLVPAGLEMRFSRVASIRDVSRIAYARVGLEMALHNPVFGVGFGNYIAEFEKYNVVDLDEPSPSHNMYVNIASQMGFPALLIYAAIIGITWRRLAVMERELRAAGRPGAFVGSFGWAVQAAFVNLAVFGLSGDVQFEYSVFTMLGFGMLLYREHRSGPAAGLEGSALAGSAAG
ncbi:MAG TPA: O-antigen ligase family protein [Candidatus Saccharimonadales bacterium]|nr:O-antigen ligase family protein [Candidatus Saccharimonadales bacterium]